MRGIIFLTVFLTPLFFLSDLFYPFIFPKSLFIQGVALILGTLFVAEKILDKGDAQRSVPKNVVFLSFAVFLFFFLISALQGVVPRLSLWGSMDHGIGFVFMLCLFVFSAVTSTVFKSREDWYELFSVSVLSGIIFSIGSLLAQTGTKFSKLLSLTKAGEFTLGNSSYSGIFLVFIFFISLGLVFSAPRKSQRVLGYVGLITVFFNPIITNLLIQAADTPFGLIGLAKTSAYSLFLGLGIFMLYIIYRKIPHASWRKIFIGFWIAAASLGLILAFLYRGQVAKIITDTAGPNRLIFWDIALKAFQERPVLGWGDDTYHLAYTKYFNPVIVSPGYSPEYFVDRAHNIYFDQLASGGIIGILSLIFLYGVLFYGLIKKAIKEDQDKIGFMYASLFAGFVAFLIQGLMIFQVVIGWFVIAILISFAANFCFTDKNIFKNSMEIRSKGVKNGVLASVIIAFLFLFNFLILKPAAISKDLAGYSVLPYPERLAAYDRLQSAYMGNITEIGNAFSPYNLKLRAALDKGLDENEVKLMKDEALKINALLENASREEEYLDMRLLMNSVGFYSILVITSEGAERQGYYDRGMFYVNKMFENSPGNPIAGMSKTVIDQALGR